MKRLQKALVVLSVLLVLCLSLGLFAACAGEGDNSASDKEGESVTSVAQSTEQPDSAVNSAITSAVTSTSAGDDQPVEPDHPVPTAALIVPEGYKEVKETLNISDFADYVGALENDLVKGVWTIPAGTSIRSRTKDWSKTAYADFWYVNALATLDGRTSLPKTDLTHSIKMGDSDSALIINAPGDGYACVYVQNGSSSATTQVVLINGEEYEYPGTSASSPVVQIWFEVEAGKQYKIVRKSGTTDLFYAELHCVAEVSEPTGISVQNLPKTEYLAGTELSMSGLVVSMQYANGTAEVLGEEAYTVDASKVDMTAAGNYEVKVTYKENAGFTTTYEVRVSALDHIALGMNATEKLGSNTAAGNGVYYNYKVKTVYGLNNTLNTDHLTVMAYNQDGQLFSFRNNDAAVTYSGYDMTSVGNKTVTVTLTLGEATATATYEIYVTDAQLASNDYASFVYVDANYNGAVGAVASQLIYEQNVSVNCFTTIGSALEFVKLHQVNTKDGPRHVNVYIAAGAYREKLEVENPNLSLIGLGETAEETLVEWDSLYGVNDESGFNGVTDSVFTMAVRETADNFEMINLTVSNYWNSKARFAERQDSAYCDHRALALLVQADKFTMKGCRLLGYQDTVEFFTGRHYIYNSYVAGVTDFIFGTNGTTYFQACEIHSIEHVKGENGYLTAMKGCNKGSSDAVRYGVIFDGCTFTADDATPKNGTAIGRTWGEYAAVAVINSTLGDHISVKAYSDSSNKGVRYIAMNAKPTADTVQFVEYGNTGAGAVTEKIDGMSRYLTADEAIAYSDFRVIFAATNGKVTYADAWAPVKLR